MSWDDDKEYFNKYSHRSADGNDVDVFGIDRNGHHHSMPNISSNSGSSNYSNTGSSSFGVGTASGIGSLILVVAALFIIGEIVKFIQANWIYIVTVLAVCIVCVIVCVVIRRSRNSGIKIFFTILTSVGLIYAFFYFDPVVYGRFSLDKLLNRIPIETPKIIPAATYAYVIPDALNVRSGPSSENRIIGSLVKDTRVEVIDNSEQWWLIKLEGIDGYVYSEYLRNE